MEEKKLIERLRICSKTYHVHCGVSCDNKVCGSCRNVLMAEAVDLINSKNETIAEQKAQIERLTEEKWQAQDDLDNYHAMYQEEVKANAELQKQVDELKERAKIDLENEKNWCKIQIRQAVKDTAKEILIAVQKKITHLRANGHLGREQDIRLSRFLVGKAQDYGVEVE